MPGFSRAFVLGTVLMTVACGQGDEPAAQASELRADEYDRAVSKLSALAYIPWRAIEGGCFARALYLSMELAAEDVPSNHVYAHGSLYGGMWGAHVAPVVTRDGEDQLYVLDPALAPDRALTLKQWIAKMGHTVPGEMGYPRARVTDGTSYWDLYSGRTVDDVEAPSAAKYGEPSLEAMPRFAIENVNAACGTMGTFIGSEPGLTVEGRSQMRRELARATRRLVHTLAAKDKIAGAEADLDPQCLSLGEH